MMEFAWNPRVGWLAGPRELCGQMFALPPGWKGLRMETFPRPVRPGFTHSPSSPRQHGRACPALGAGGQATEQRPRGPLRDNPPQGWRAQQQTIGRPGSGRTTHGKATTSQPEARKCCPWSVAAAGVGPPPSCPQDGTSESKQHRGQCKGLLGLAQVRATQESGPRSKGGTRAGEVGRTAC